jgi:hypothetical protein
VYGGGHYGGQFGVHRCLVGGSGMTMIDAFGLGLCIGIVLMGFYMKGRGS